ncbi:glycoside hydrolase family 3 protein [Virgibacillus salidurans]|uniref:glycoside hydrolase family 3 protein n=1 Tax=Virgibacillus salidurans TaxID=2831673 RepID=UPI001F229176|nr:glycoside hydrolase family 3 protein [Virgibacillus sp. NKC19-16]
MKVKGWKRMLPLFFVFVLVLPLYGYDSSNNQDDIDWIESKIGQMTLEEKIGQLFVIHAYGETPTDPNYEETNLGNNRGGKNFKEIIENYHIGGVIYFNWSHNIGTPLDGPQVNALSNGLQEIAMDQPTSIPLFISTDQEGGTVQRVTEPGTVFPGNMAIGATRSEDYARDSAQILGKELNSLGINMNFAPTVDVNINPENPVIGVRSFGEDPDLVSDLGVAQIMGYKNENIMSSVKHFPGHGDTDVDSHYGLPIIDHDIETLHEVDLKPFKAAIDAGVESIMTAHIVVPALDDSGLPATLSKPIITDLLRGELGYDGLVITDSLDMSGANVVPPERVSVESFKAGVDVLLNPPDVEMAFNSMLEAVENGEISEARLDESVFRILQAKMRNGLFEDPYTDPDRVENIGTEEHLQTAEEIANKSITLVKNESDLLPLHTTDNVLVTGPSQAKTDLVANSLIEKGMEASSFETGTSPSPEEIDEAVDKAEEVDIVVVTSYVANTNQAQQQLVSQLEDSGKPIVVTALHNPYDIMAFPEVDAYAATYGYQDVSALALSNVLAGEINPSGELPVTIPEMYEYGHGLSYAEDPLSAANMELLVEQFEEEGEFENNQVARSLAMHLTAVSHYEQTESTEKVLKHMEGFQLLLDQQKIDELISEKAYNHLQLRATRLIDYIDN